MTFWLLKTEPSTYSYADLERDKHVVWDGVTNPLALKHLRTIKKGDRAFVYHTGDEKQIVGIAEITSAPYADSKQKDPRLVVVDLAPRERLARPVTLAEIKSRKEFADWELVCLSRLSAMPVNPDQWMLICQLAKRK